MNSKNQKNNNRKSNGNYTNDYNERYNYFTDFCNIYWRYKNCLTNDEKRFFNSIMGNDDYIMEFNQKALMGYAPVEEIIRDWPEETELLYAYNTKYEINPFLGAMSAYAIKYHPHSQHLQNNIAIKCSLEGENMPKTVMTFKK